MKRQFQKALSIVVASSLALSMPVTTMADEAVSRTTVGGAERSVENQTEKTESGGISATNGQTVTKNGDVVAKNTHGVYASDKSKVTVDGNVITGGDKDRIAGIYNAGSDVKVTGNVTSDAYGVVAEENASTTVKGSVTAKSTGVNISTGYNDKTTQDSVVRVDKGITVTGGRQYNHGPYGKLTNIYADGADITKTTKGKVDLQVNGDILTTAKNDRDEKHIDRASSTGLGVTNVSGEVSVKINGNIRSDSFAGSRNFATGVIIIGDDEDNPTDKTQKTDVAVKGNIAAKSDYRATGINFDDLHGTTNVAVDGNIEADAKDGTARGIIISSEDENSNTTIIVNGDVKGSTYGTSFDEFDGTANVVINGTLSGGKSAVIINKTTDVIMDDDGENDENGENKVVTEKRGYNGNSNITVWKMTSEQKDLVRVEEHDYTKGEDECKVDAEAANKVLKNINYIIRTDKVSNGTIHLSNTRLISGFDTARETEDITIKVEASDGYKVDSVKNGDAVLKKNADGTYTLTVPRGGGVQLSAVLSAIQKSHSSSGSSGGSSGTRPGVTSTNVQTIPSSSGASVATTVSDSNGTRNTNAVVKIADKQATVNTSEQTGNGNSIIIRNVSGDVAGATFAGVGTVSADGKSITTIDGQVYAVTYAPMLIIKTGDQTVGCFVDLTTGAPLATGKTEVYYQLAADGQMYAHWVNPMGFFYTGTVVMNGHTVTFNEQGVMIDVR